MAIILVVLDDAQGEIVDVIKRDSVSIFPFGAQQFGPSPNNNPFPQIQNAYNVLEYVNISNVRDGIRESPFLNDAQRTQYSGIIEGYLPGDRIVYVGQTRAAELGLVAPLQAGDVPPPPKVLIQIFVDP